jgi:hypothetical protein
MEANESRIEAILAGSVEIDKVEIETEKLIHNVSTASSNLKALQEAAKVIDAEMTIEAKKENSTLVQIANEIAVEKQLPLSPRVSTDNSVPKIKKNLTFNNDSQFRNKPNSYDMDRYLQRLSFDNDAKSNYSTTNTEGTYSSNWSSKPSLIAERLKRDDQVTNSLRSSFSSYSQEMLFRSMKEVVEARKKEICDSKAQSKSKSKDIKREKLKYINKLVQPTHQAYTSAEIAKDPTLRYSLYDDAKECTFKPKHNKRQSESKGDDSDAKDSDSNARFLRFIGNIESKERSKLHDLETARGKEEYKRKLDKKYCPSCGAEQSYDDIQEKRSKCLGCNVAYKPKISWNTVQRKFFEREKHYSELREQARIKLTDELSKLKRPEQHKYDPKTGKIVVGEDIDVLKFTKQVAEDFFERLNNFETDREEAIKKLEEKIYSKFKPFKRHGSDEDEDDDVENAIQQFLNRYYEDLDERKKKTPWKFRNKIIPDTTGFKV